MKMYVSGLITGHAEHVRCNLYAGWEKSLGVRLEYGYAAGSGMEAFEGEIL